MIYLIYIVVLIAYFKFPKYLRLIIFIANLFVPESIPVIDELIMAVGLLMPSDTNAVEG